MSTRILAIWVSECPNDTHFTNNNHFLEDII